MAVSQMRRQKRQQSALQQLLNHAQCLFLCTWSTAAESTTQIETPLCAALSFFISFHFCTIVAGSYCITRTDARLRYTSLSFSLPIIQSIPFHLQSQLAVFSTAFISSSSSSIPSPALRDGDLDHGPWVRISSGPWTLGQNLFDIVSSSLVSCRFDLI